MNPCCATRLLAVSAMLEPCINRAATWITWCDRLWAHTSRFGDAFGAYKRIMSFAYGSLGRSTLRASSRMPSALLREQSLHAERPLPWALGVAKGVTNDEQSNKENGTCRCKKWRRLLGQASRSEITQQEDSPRRISAHRKIGIVRVREQGSSQWEG